MNEDQALNLIFTVVCFVMGTLLEIPQFNRSLDPILRGIGIASIIVLYFGGIVGLRRLTKETKA